MARNDTTSLICAHRTVAMLNCSLEYCETLNKNLERFWEVETVLSETKRALSADEQQCEEFFERTTCRDDSGRFVVRLPFREDPTKLGRSRETALRRLVQLERRFAKNKTLHERYTEFMREYQELGHMSPASDLSRDAECTVVYLPHHGVIKEASSSTKLRTVFDASSKTESGISLNDILHVGPTLQSTLIEILMRFRVYKVAVTGDLRKMYRQILIHTEDRDYQRILWREAPDKPVEEFRLNTVTYGETSSPYLAIKCVRQLAEQAQEYPIAARVILEEMYVDDIMTGADDVEGAIAVQQQLTTLLKTGGFEIHKWCSSHSDSLVHVAQAQRAISTHRIDSSDTIETLGLEWCPHEDKFQCSITQPETATTKRPILSAISKFFDPLGLIGPILTSAKLLMQETWRINQHWDETLPVTFVEKWEGFRQELNAADALCLPRRVLAFNKLTQVYIHGFCDASEKAYGACIYMQAENEDSVLESRLLWSKSRVAPIKSLSIPRLELCSAVLLARLMASVQKSLQVRIDGVQAWSDSTVALCWIRGESSRWKTFVANRVSEIIQKIPAKHWDYVRGEENPADLISRGTSPLKLKTSKLWWAGPSWLKEKRPSGHSDSDWEPSQEAIELMKIEVRNTASTCNLISKGQQTIQELIDKYSSLTRIERVLAYCLRFISNLKTHATERTLTQLSVEVLKGSHRRIIQHIQASQFGNEISTLKSGGILKKSSKLIQAHPFLDEHGILRVGGRLQHASLTFERKHPIILPAGNKVSKLLFEREHRRLLHASQLLLLSTVRGNYWLLKGRDLARQVCRDCVWCSIN